MALLDLTPECLNAAEGIFPELPVDDNGKRQKPPLRMNIFQNLFIENYLAQAHPITPGIWFGWLLPAAIYWGWPLHGSKVLALIALGFLITTLIEYLLHRLVFHFVPKTKFQRLQVFMMHGYHHDFPNDRMRLVLPPLAIWPLAAIFALVYSSTMGVYWFPIFAGTAIGYVAYDWTHYYTHHFNPKFAPLKWIKRYHMLHHHDSPTHRYGITSPLWDLVFGTYLPTNKMVRAANAQHANHS